MLRLNEPTQTKLQELVERFDASKAEITHQLIALATPEDFPKSWQMRAAERAVPAIRPDETKHARESTR